MSQIAEGIRVIFFFVSLLTLAYYPFVRWGSEENPCIMRHPWYTSFESLFPICYAVQCLTLTMLFYVTVVLVFRNTTFSISNCVQTVYKVLFTFSGIFIIAMGITNVIGTEWQLLAAIGLLMYIITMFSMTILFITKLKIIYRHKLKDQESSDNHQTLMAAITKLTLLMSISLLLTLLQMLMITIRIIKRTEGTALLVHCCGLIDVYTNFMNTMLANEILADYYGILCGNLDSMCKKCWIKKLGEVQRLPSVSE